MIKYLGAYVMGKWINSINPMRVDCLGQGICKNRGVYKTLNNDTVFVVQFENLWYQRIYMVITDFYTYLLTSQKNMVMPPYSRKKLEGLVSKWQPNYAERHNYKRFNFNNSLFAGKIIDDVSYEVALEQSESEIEKILANVSKRKIGIK